MARTTVARAGSRSQALDDPELGRPTGATARVLAFAQPEGDEAVRGIVGREPDLHAIARITRIRNRRMRPESWAVTDWPVSSVI
jgi:hypothetical protein